MPLEPLDDALTALESDVLEGARSLLGLTLVRGGRRARIVEVEAYRTPDDPACHAHRGVTDRNRVMFGPAGRAYVYFNYGVHWMLNVTAHHEGSAAAVLIRAAHPLAGLDDMGERRPKARRERDLLSGPGKLAAAFDVTSADNGMDLFEAASAMHFEPGHRVGHILSGPRIGIKVGCEHAWRFVDAGAREWISAARSPLR